MIPPPFTALSTEAFNNQFCYLGALGLRITRLALIDVISIDTQLSRGTASLVSVSGLHQTLLSSYEYRHAD